MKSITLSIFLGSTLLSCVHSAIFGLFERKQYTPLIMFKVPKGTVEESDEMEKVVKKVERELGVKVERLDILRDRFARNLYEKIDEYEFKGKIPLLYNRESLQCIYGLETKSRVKAWATGRLHPKVSSVGADERAVGSDGFVSSDEEQEEFMEQDLTELQQSGRDKMIERLENEVGED
jgi:hypothetical protein